ncbi:hypothetical protein SAY87_031938 [Trapa incisa]|uniref:C2 NT-type domain-containing protein n=1 Tax=Trapa incisa TaxID=236973 RepID=A0AAN7QMB7_9MYRT|nr:hypothetical protein SAY87_031938 [Trapa incisa]
MFRPVRWRSDRSKIKAVFKLQFHATQVSGLGADSLMIYVVPGHAGKPTVRLEKADIKDGGCRWDSPVHETVKFTRDPKTGKIHERIYYFILSTGLGKSSIVGEVAIDLAAYAEATRASSVSLPIKSSYAKASLNVLIQRLQDSVDHWDIEGNEAANVKVQDRSLRSRFNKDDDEESIKGSSIEGVPSLNQALCNVVASDNFSASSGSDLTTSSESGSAMNTPRENTIRSNSTIQRDPNRFLSPLSSVSLPHESISDGAIVLYGETPKSPWEWSHCPNQDGIVFEEGEHGSELVKLRSELSSLGRQLNLSELELQTLRKQVVKESKRSHELSKEAANLKEERHLLEDENVKLRARNEQFRATKEKSRLPYGCGDLHELLEELKQEVNYEKNLNSDLRLQLQKMQESNAELILAVKDLEEMLDHKSKDSFHLGGKLSISDEEDEEQKALEAIVMGQKDDKETYLLEQKILDLNGEVEIYRRDRDELEIQMEQLALDYEILKQKHHEVSYKWEQSQLQEQLKLQYECCTIGNEKMYESKIERLESELKMKSEKFADSLATASELERNIKGLEEKLLIRSGELSDSLANASELESKVKKVESELLRRSEELSDSLETIGKLESKLGGLERTLQIKSEELSNSLTTIDELESKVDRLEGELLMKSEEISNSLATKHKLEGIAEKSEVELKKRSDELSDSLATVSELERRNQILESELSKGSEIYSDSLATIRELNNKIERLETELGKRSEEFSNSLATASELEKRVKDLEEDLDNRTQGFVDNLSDVTRAKVEQEKRAISAEEALQKMKWKNFDTADRLQKEFMKLSLQLASTFESNERVAIKAVREAAELRKANENLQSVNLENETKLEELSREFFEKSKYLEDEITRLSAENTVLSARVGEAKLVIDTENAERKNMVAAIALLKQELEEKDVKVRDLELELETLKIQLDNLRGSMCESESEKKRLTEEMVEVKEELREQEGALLIFKKRLEESNLQIREYSLVASSNKEIANLQGKITSLEDQINEKKILLECLENSFLEKEKYFTTKIDELEGHLEELGLHSSGFSKCQPQKVDDNPKELNPEDVQTDEVKEAWDNRQSKLDDLSAESALLKERNDSMEIELKEMQERYSELSLRFAEVEGERQKLVMTVRYLKNARKK